MLEKWSIKNKTTERSFHMLSIKSGYVRCDLIKEPLVEERR